jgi:DNA-directed RNA polymerase specialized sigma24 family protein
MALHTTVFGTDDFEPGRDIIWYELYNSLRPYILACVYAARVSCWHGQERDIAEDVLQETIIRTMKYTRQAEAGQTTPIYSMMCFGRTVAYNHIRDLRRRDLRLFRPESYDQQPIADFSQFVEVVDPAEIALEELNRYALWKSAALVIAQFPEKQQNALLIDLARRTDFQDERSSLGSAFLSVGIDLHDYHQLLPVDPAARGRHAALLSIAYKRLRESFLHIGEI